MYEPQAAIWDRLESELAIGLFIEKNKLERRRLTGLLWEAEDFEMNQRLRDLAEWREKNGKNPGTTTVTDTPTPPPASFAEATAAVLKPSAPAAAKPIASGAKKLNDLTKKRIAFNADLGSTIDAYSAKLDSATTKKAAIFAKANAAVDDEIAGFDQLDSALSEFEGANGGPLSSG